jgi:hypothetical protein
MGGTVLGLSSVVAGRFVGAVVGRAIDQRIMGQGADPVETGRVDRLRIMGAGEGDPVARIHGRMRVAGQVIWATQSEEVVATSGGGKGAPRSVRRDYSYRVSLAVALCEGVISGVGRIWADGTEIAPSDLTLRVYTGGDDQLPDPKMEAVEGAGAVPAYRGTAYVVIEDMDLSPFGNRVPQLAFEVIRPAPEEIGPDDPARLIRGVAMMPGTGEYALATTPVTYDHGAGRVVSANVNSPSAKADFATALDQIEASLPACDHVSLIVSWFGDDLRCGSCQIRPGVEQAEKDGTGMPWSVSGVNRGAAMLVPQEDDRPVYGGTPCDAAVIEALREMAERGQKVLYYPFILMTQMAGNGLVDPYTGDPDQAVLPWRGRITSSVAPGVAGGPDGTAAVAAEVAAFFGTAAAVDFAVGDGGVSYSGPAEWSFRRFILHQAALCAAAGGVDAFCIGSEMVGLTTLRDDQGFPAVAALVALAAEVRVLLPEAKLTYAADWSEYFGFQPGNGDRFFHLDPLWADANIDAIGIDNYMPLSDWREGDDHLDAGAGSIYDLGYLKGNIEGGEGFDWFYHSSAARAAQIRTPITDGEGEPWIWRYKDIRSWWQNAHYDRIGGVRASEPTAWVPQSKPVWFTELGCAAVDKGTNQPNKFLDPKSSESSLPYFSTGRRDDVIAMQYLRAMLSYWGDGAVNPVSAVYDAPMVDMARAYVWAWDARPYPWFPNARDVWADGANYSKGHWITGRASARSLAGVVAEICQRSGLLDFDVSGLSGVVWGYEETPGSARAALQPLMLRYGFDAVDRDGRLRFVMRDGAVDAEVSADTFCVTGDTDGTLEEVRASEADMAGRVRLRFIEAEGSFEVIAEEAVLPGDGSDVVAAQEMPLAMLRGEGRQVVERWLAEAQVARDTVRFTLPPSRMAVGAGDVLRLGAERFRVDRVDRGAGQLIEAVRIEAEAYRPVDVAEEVARVAGFVPPMPVFPLFLDLPLMTGDEVPHAPHLAVTAQPWPGTVAVYGADEDADYLLDRVVDRRAVIGVTQAPLAAAPMGRVDRGEALAVRLTAGDLASVGDVALLSGRNLMAIGDGTPGGWELIQFRDAVPAGDGVWLISHRLRGQLGTDVGVPAVWPAGSYVVVLDGAVGQIGLTAGQRGVSRHYRIGPAQRDYADGSYVHDVHAFSGVGLRPLSPVHLRAVDEGGDLRLSWVRRSRVSADGWDGLDVPLGEETERYVVRVMDGAAVVREAVVDTPQWVYAAAEQVADGGVAGKRVEVAQVSAVVGPGGWAVRAFH